MALSLKIENGGMIMIMALNIGGDIRNGIFRQKLHFSRALRVRKPQTELWWIIAIVINDVFANEWGKTY